MENELPEGWLKTTIGEIYTFVGGGTPSKAKSSYWNGNIPWASIKDISQVDKLVSTQDYISEEGLKDSASNLAQVDEIIIGTRMSPGKPVLTKIITSINQDLKIVRSRFPIPPLFTFYLFKFLRNEFEAKSGGTTVKGIRLEVINEVRVSLPPLAEQTRIVAKLDAAFGHLETLKTSLARIPELLKKFRQTVLTQAVTGKLTGSWRKENPDVESVQEFLNDIAQKRRFFHEKQLYEATKKKASKPVKPNYLDYSVRKDSYLNSAIPETWITAKVGLLCDCIVPGRDKPKSFTGDIPWITIPDLTNDTISHSKSGLALNEDEIEEVGAKIIPTGSVVMSCIGRFGIASQVETPVVINQQLHAFLESELIYAKYLMYHIRTLESYMISTATSTTIAYLNKTNCNSLPINLPPLEEQQEIVTRVEVLFAKADALEAQYLSLKARIDALPQALLAKAFRGALVPQNLADEPASVLLARLKSAPAPGGKAKTGQTKLAFMGE